MHEAETSPTSCRSLWIVSASEHKESRYIPALTSDTSAIKTYES